MKSNYWRALLVALTLMASACGAITDAVDDATSDDESETETQGATELRTKPTTDGAEVESSLEDGGEDASVEDVGTDAGGTEAGGRGKADGSLPGDAMALANSTFSYQGPYGDEVWEVATTGLLSVDVSDFNDETGTCFVLFGTMTPIVAENDISKGYSTPDTGLIVEGRQYENNSLVCDVEALEDAGYSPTYNAEVTIGTSFAFFEEYFLPDTGPQSVDTVVVGDPTSDGAVYLTADAAELVPPSTVVGDNAFLAGALPYAGAEIQYTDAFDDASWEGTIDTLVTAEVRFDDDAGTCLFLVGTMAPTMIEEGLVTSSFDSPDFGLLVDGHYIKDSFYKCDEEAVLFAGYSDLGEAEVAVGTDYHYFVEFFVPAGSGEIQAIVMGDSGSDIAQYFLPGPPAAEIPVP